MVSPAVVSDGAGAVVSAADSDGAGAAEVSEGAVSVAAMVPEVLRLIVAALPV